MTRHSVSFRESIPALTVKFYKQNMIGGSLN
jgi:hypothetical protein